MRKSLPPSSYAAYVLQIDMPGQEPYQHFAMFPVQFTYGLNVPISWSLQTQLAGPILLMPHLHIRTSGGANDEHTNHLFASSFVASFASPFVALALEAVFPTRVKGDERFIRVTCTNM